MTTPRFLSGLHPLLGTMGIWMTNAGIDVSTNTIQENFALSPDVKMEQVWLSGAVGLNPSTSTSIPYPVALTNRPYVYFQVGFSSGLIAYPYPLGMVGPSANVAFAVGLRVYNNRIDITNGQAIGFWIHYMVFRRTIGS